MNGNWEEVVDIKMLTGAARRKLKEFRDVDTTGDFEGHGSFLRHVVSKLERLAILEAAVAWHGFDEVPERDPYTKIEIVSVAGHITETIVMHIDQYQNNPDYRGWRYSVGDLSE